MEHGTNFSHTGTPPSEAEGRATTRELPLTSPARPIATPALVLGQVLLTITGLALLAASTTAALVLLVAAVVAFPFTTQGWRWLLRYPTSRLLTSKKLDKLTPGTWIVAPGSKYAVVIKDEPVGSPENPTIADGLTREELAIIAPVYSFREAPKKSRES